MDDRTPITDATTRTVNPFVALWRNAVDQRAEQSVHEFSGSQVDFLDCLTTREALRRSLLMAGALREKTGIQLGSRVAILADGYGEIFPLYHALWLAGVTVVTIPTSLPQEVLVHQLNNSEVEGLVYTSCQLARLATVLPKVAPLAWRLLCGGSGNGSSFLVTPRSFSLRELLQGAPEAPLLENLEVVPGRKEDCALIAFSPGESGDSSGAAFSSAALLAAAQNQAGLYQQRSQQHRVASLLPSKSLVSTIQMLLVPLVAGTTSIDLRINFEEESSSQIARRLRANTIGAAWIDQGGIDVVRSSCSLTKTELPHDFDAFLIPSKPIEISSLGRAGEYVIPCYGLLEAGGIATVGERGAHSYYTHPHVHVGKVLTAGRPLPGVKVKIKSESTTTEQPLVMGEILIASSQLMTAYAGSNPGAAYNGPDQWLNTGDRGLWVETSSGERELVVVGRKEHFIRRAGEEINLFEIERAIRAIAGVRDVMVVGFPNEFVGTEIGAHVVVQKWSSTSQRLIMKELAKLFPQDHLPKVMVVDDDLEPLTSMMRRELVEFFKAHARENFPREELSQRDA